VKPRKKDKYSQNREFKNKNFIKWIKRKKRWEIQKKKKE